jgi:ABC-2 type transport system ATP-binding protein
VLHRRRRELLVWVLLPVLAVIITAGSYAGAVFSRGSTRAAHMSLVTFRPEAADAVTSTAVTSPGGGEVTITFPDGWRAVPSTSDWDGSTDPTSDAVLDAGGATGRLRLDPAGIGITAASGGIRAGDGLVVSARSDGSSVTGTVRNATPYDLSGAAVLVGKDHTAIGDLPAGEERPWRLAGEPQRSHFTLPGPDLWPLISQVQDVNHDLWRQAGSRFGPDFLRPGDAVAVGWTRGWRPAVSVSGAAGRPDGRSLLIARTPVVHASGGVPAQAITRQIVRGGMPVDPEPGTDQSMSPDPMVLRFVLPTGGNGGGLVFKAPENLLRLEVWQDGTRRAAVLLRAGRAVGARGRHAGPHCAAGRAQRAHRLPPRDAGPRPRAAHRVGLYPEGTGMSASDAAATVPEVTPVENGSAVRMRGLSKRYGTLRAVDDLSLDVPRGAVFGLIGPNGAGKSTTMAIVASLLSPDHGEVEVFGYDPRTEPLEVRRRIGYMPDVMGVYEGIQVDEYLDFFAAAYDVPAPERPAIIDGLLELVDLTVKRGSLVDSLSRGMKQRLSLARALVHDPELLILDEPASGLDAKARIELRELLIELCRMDKTVIISSHILSELEEMCTEVAIIEAGRLLVAGPPSEIRDRLVGERTIIVRLAGGEQQVHTVVDEDEQRRLLHKLLVTDELPIVEFIEKGGRLEDLYMRITKGIVQ